MQLRKSNKTACIVGATGLIGRTLWPLLCQSDAYQRVLIYARSAPDRRELSRYPKAEWIALPRQQLRAPEQAGELVDELFDDLPTGDDFFSCLGTTRAKAGSAYAFAAVDYSLNYALACAASKRGYHQYLLVSSSGADPQSWALYPRTKGRLELDVRSVPFWSTHLFRPGILVGDRRESRFAESVAADVLQGVERLLGRRLNGFGPIEDAELGKAMVQAAQQTAGGIFVHDNASILSLSGAFDRT